MVPFITEHVWQNLITTVKDDAAESVHLATFPLSDPSLIDNDLSRQVALTRRLVELGRAARAESAVKIRQPLSRALISASGWQSLPAELRDQISDELNVLTLDDLSVSGDLVDVSIKANFRSLGAKFGASVQAIAKAIHAEEAAQLVTVLRSKGSTSIEYNDVTGTVQKAEITTEDVLVTETPREGWTYASAHGESLALDLALTPELIAQGIAREAIRLIQDERKALGFDISDRITLVWNASEEHLAAITAHSHHIGEEVLATEIKRDATLALADNEIGLALRLERQKIS
jgi:isoleucyl-tRNA synthetase